jgi:hypothetical protein
MNITDLRRRLESTVIRPREGESWEFVLERQRELKPNRLLFWRVLIRTLSKFLVKVYSVSLSASESLAFALTFGLHEFAQIYWDSLLETPPKIELPRYESDRGPPEIFTPLPDFEIGGCARNDALIATAIN